MKPRKAGAGGTHSGCMYLAVKGTDESWYCSMCGYWKDHADHLAEKNGKRGADFHLEECLDEIERLQKESLALKNDNRVMADARMLQEDEIDRLRRAFGLIVNKTIVWRRDEAADVLRAVGAIAREALEGR